GRAVFAGEFSSRGFRAELGPARGAPSRNRLGPHRPAGRGKLDCRDRPYRACPDLGRPYWSRLVVPRCLLLLLAWLGAAGAAQAHLASDSYLRIDIGAGGAIGGQWAIALRDLDVAVGLDADQDGAITWGELHAKEREIAAYAFERLTLARNG